jgi:hypothetical protein
LFTSQMTVAALNKAPTGVLGRERAGPRRAGPRYRRGAALARQRATLRQKKSPQKAALWPRQGKREKDQIMPEDAEPTEGMRSVIYPITMTQLLVSLRRSSVYYRSSYFLQLLHYFLPPRPSFALGARVNSAGPV